MSQQKTMSDEQIAKSVRNGDQELFRVLVERYQQKLTRYVRRLTQDEHLADDIVQESFIKAYTHLNSFDVRRSFNSWMYRITHNEAMNHVKRPYRLDISLKDVLFFWNGTTNTEDEYEHKELQLLVKQSLTELTADYRAVLTLYFLEEKTYEEISEILKVPLGTVGTRIHRAKRALKEVIKRKDKAYATQK